MREAADHTPAAFRRARAGLAGLLLALLAAGQGLAAETGPASGRLAAPSPQRPLLEEIRLGLYAHDPVSPEKGAADVNGELVLAPFDPGSGPLGRLTPRVHVGGTWSFGARTSLAYAGFLWRLHLNEGVFLEAAFGGAVHNGRDAQTPGRNAMGCRGAFHESLSLGYRFAPQWRVMATIEHASNAGLCDSNRGVTNAGLRIGYAF